MTTSKIRRTVMAASIFISNKLLCALFYCVLYFSVFVWAAGRVVEQIACDSGLVVRRFAMNISYNNMTPAIGSHNYYFSLLVLLKTLIKTLLKAS